MSVGVIPGVGPVTAEKLHRIGIRTVADLQGFSLDELAQLIGRAHAQALVELAYARDDRPVEPERETKSISVEDTFETDVADLAELARDPAPGRAARSPPGWAPRGCSRGRCRSRCGCPTSPPSPGPGPCSARPTGAEVIGSVATSLLGAVNVAGGVRLLGVGVAGLTDAAAGGPVRRRRRTPRPDRRRRACSELAPSRRRRAGLAARAPTSSTTSTAAAGSGAPGSAGSPSGSRPGTPRPGPVRTFAVDDPALRRVDPA